MIHDERLWKREDSTQESYSLKPGFCIILFSLGSASRVGSSIPCREVSQIHRLQVGNC